MASWLDSIFGAKPDVAAYTPTDLGASELQAIMDNIDAWPQIENLGNLYENYMLNSFDTAGLDLGSILRQGGIDVQAELAAADPLLHGQIPKDVLDQIQRSSAFTNLMAGTSGSPMGGANTARDLGLTSLDLISKGAGLVGEAGASGNAFATLAGKAILNPATMMVTPQEQAALTMQNNLYTQATRQLQNNINAAPDPALQALNQWVEQLGGTIIGSYAGAHGGNYKTSYDPAAEGATPINPGQSAAFTSAFGPSMESAFAGTDAFGQPISAPPTSDTGYVPTNSYLPNSGYNTSPYYGSYGYSGTPPPIFGGSGYDFQFNPYGGG